MHYDSYAYCMYIPEALVTAVVILVIPLESISLEHALLAEADNCILY